MLARYPHLRVLVGPDGGQSEALNKGFRLARGEIVCWLNADDLYLPSTFARIRPLFADPAVDIVYGDVLVRYPAEGREFRRAARFGSYADMRVWHNVKVHQPAVFFRRRLFGTYGYLREDLHYIMDLEFWSRLVRHCTIRYIPETLAVQVYHGDCKSMAYQTRFLEERKRVFGPEGLTRAERRQRRREIARRYGDLAAERRNVGLWLRALWERRP